MKYLTLCLLLLSTTAFGFGPKSGRVQECKRPNVLVDLASLPPASREYEKCKLARTPKCCVDPMMMQPECRKPKTLINLNTTRLTKAAYALCKENLIPGTHNCCIDLSAVIEAPLCPRGTVLTELSSLKPTDPRYKECMNSLIPGTKNCCLRTLTKLQEGTIQDIRQIKLRQ